MSTSGTPGTRHHPLARFLHTEAASGVLLLLATIAALLWANSPWGGAYEAAAHLEIAIRVGPWELVKTLLHWINDGLMAIFFFLVGLEIKREMQTGELASPRLAALPIAAAIGGMAVPAAIYTLCNQGGPGASGWGVPMATDIAFSLGILAMLGKRVPAALKGFLAALAIVDDLGAVLVIAVFYTESISWGSLAGGAALLALSLGLNHLGVRRPLAYALIGIVIWLLFLRSGVHATVAGVLMAFTIPSKRRIDTISFIANARGIVDEFERADDPLPLTNAEQHALVGRLEARCEEVQPPLQRIEHTLQPWVAFGIMPLFALANAGLVVGGDFLAVAGNPIGLGIILGLVVGKPLGVLLATWLAIRLGLASLPRGVGVTHLAGIGCLAGVGFTMALFIAGLAFGESANLDSAKAGILIASTISGVLGVVVLLVAARRAPGKSAAA